VTAPRREASENTFLMRFVSVCKIIDRERIPMSDKTLDVTFEVLGAHCLSCQQGVLHVERPILDDFLKTHSGGVCELEYEVKIVSPVEYEGRRSTVRFTQEPS
jgi:hypothetical protein